MRDIKLTPTTTPNLYQIAYRGPTPEIAAKVVDATFEFFGRTSAGSKLRNSQDADFFLKTQLQDYAARLTEAENRLDAFKARHFGSSGVSSQDYFARIATLNEEVDKLRVEAKSAEQVRNALRRELATAEPALPLELTPRADITRDGNSSARRRRMRWRGSTPNESGSTTCACASRMRIRRWRLRGPRWNGSKPRRAG